MEELHDRDAIEARSRRDWGVYMVESPPIEQTIHLSSEFDEFPWIANSTNSSKSVIL